MEPYSKTTPLGLSFPYVEEVNGSEPALSVNGRFPIRTYQAWTNSLSGFRLPDWRSKIRNHENATTPLDASSRSYKVRYGEFTTLELRDPPYYPMSFQQKRIETSVAGAIATVPTAAGPPPEDPTVANEAVIGFLGKIRERQRLFQGGVALGELKETIRLLRDPARALRQRLHDYTESLKKVKRRSRGRNIGTLQDAWLTWQFGVRPLQRDIQDATYAMSEFAKLNEEIIQTVKFRAKRETSVSEVTQSGYTRLRAVVMNERNTITRSTVRYKGGVRVRSSSYPLLDPALMGFSLEEFVPTAWELLPWSFLWDYFSNIGDVLAAWTTCTSNLVWCCRTSRRLRITRNTPTISIPATRAAYWTSNDCQGSVSGNGGFTELTEKRVTRSNGISDAPRISFTIPDLGDLRWINMAALVRSKRDLGRW